MAGDRADSGDLPAELQRESGALDAPGPACAQGTLAYRLGSLVDRLRAIPSRLGMRPYRVYLLHGYWTGDRRGHGDLIISSRRELKPTPQVRDMSAVRQRLLATGRVEEGDVYVDEISMTLTEAEMMGDTDDLRDPMQPGTGRDLVDFWWEVQEVRPSDPKPLIRGFVPSAAPHLDRDNKLQWSIVLTKRDGDPGREGDPQSAHEVRSC